MPAPCSRVFVFDLDDTLYLERDYARSGFTAVGEWAAETIGLEGFGNRCWELFKEGVRGTIFNQASAEMLGKECSDQVGQMVQVFRSHTPEIKLLPDAKRILDHCNSIPTAGTALITDGYLEAQQKKIDALKLTKTIDLIIATDQWGRDFWKPHPRAYTTVESFFRARPENCCYIADNPRKDFIVPRQRGWLTVRISRDGGEYNSIEHLATDADIQCASLDELCHHSFFQKAE